METSPKMCVCVCVKGARKSNQLEFYLIRSTAHHDEVLQGKLQDNRIDMTRRIIFQFRNVTRELQMYAEVHFFILMSPIAMIIRNCEVLPLGWNLSDEFTLTAR